MSNASSSFTLICWNVRGLGDRKKCDLVKETLLSNSEDIVLLQETKLNNIDRFKSSSFLPATLQNFISYDAINTSRGHLTTWNANKLKLLSSSTKPFSLSTQLESQANGTIFWITNVYSPNIYDERPAFFWKLESWQVSYNALGFLLGTLIPSVALKTEAL
jgi:exonuclease III